MPEPHRTWSCVSRLLEAIVDARIPASVHDSLACSLLERVLLLDECPSVNGLRSMDDGWRSPSLISASTWPSVPSSFATSLLPPLTAVPPAPTVPSAIASLTTSLLSSSAALPLAAQCMGTSFPVPTTPLLGALTASVDAWSSPAWSRSPRWPKTFRGRQSSYESGWDSKGRADYRSRWKAASTFNRFEILAAGDPHDSLHLPAVVRNRADLRVIRPNKRHWRTPKCKLDYAASLAVPGRACETAAEHFGAGLIQQLQPIQNLTLADASSGKDESEGSARGLQTRLRDRVFETEVSVVLTSYTDSELRVVDRLGAATNHCL